MPGYTPSPYGNSLSSSLPTGGGPRTTPDAFGFPGSSLPGLADGQGGPGSSTNINMPAYEQYDPWGGNPELSGNLSEVADVGRGMMDPNSDYYKRLSAAMQRQIGGQSQAQQRSAALRGAWGGLGGGQGGEVMQSTADISQSGLEAQGRAEGDLALRGPTVGAGIMASTFNPMLGISQLQEGSRQYGAGLGENARQYGGNMALNLMGMAQQNEQFDMDAYLRELAMQYGQF